MTQFKDKSRKHAKNVNAGLFNYPALMAADILLYGTNLVPIGDDQKQHLELARNLAERFNNQYGGIFSVPEPYVPPVGARIMSLQDPTRKMDKSDPNPANYIAMLDEPDEVKRKIKRAVTDSGSIVKYDPARPGISNLVSIHSCLAGASYEAIRDRFAGRGYGILKKELADRLVALLEPIQRRFRSIRSDERRLLETLNCGAEKACAISSEMMERVYDKIGFVRRT
jgi:tryptophanyl-tRNA synthetase